MYNGTNCTTTFLPLNTNIGGPLKYVKGKETICLTKDQARHIYEKVALQGIVIVNTITQEIEEDELNKDNIDDDEVNPYHNIIINNNDRENVITSQMEQW